MILLLFLCAFFATTHATYVISVYGDVYKNVNFFNRTYPWIIDNIGGELAVEYYMMGSGRYTVPLMCVLKEFRSNTFLQAQYLKCEAQGNPSEFCLCEIGIDPKKYQQCVATGGYLASTAAAKFKNLGVDTTPIIELGSKGTVFGVDDDWYLKKICSVFGSTSQPRGCVKPFDCIEAETFSDKKAIAQFERECQKELPVRCDVEQPLDLTYDRPTTMATNKFSDQISAT